MSVLKKQNEFLTGTTASTTKVGKDAMAYCGRCKLNLSHTIITMGETSPDRVLCNTCKTERAYKAPKSDLASLKNKKLSKGDSDASENEEGFDPDGPEVSKALLGEDGKKKPKSKAKAKTKKAKGDSEPRTTKAQAATLPLSMLPGTSEDMAQFEARIAGQKNLVANAKTYKPDQRFNTGEAMHHPVFGVGFVVGESGLTKLEVIFKVGRKLIVTASKK